MPTVEYTVTNEQLAELKLALDHHRGQEAGTATGADLKEWGKGHFQGLVQKYRESVHNAASPVVTTEITD